MRTEDGQIIQKCLSGEREAFGFLVDKYKESVYAFAYARLGNFHDAQDITQEVFIKAYQKLGSLKQWDKFLAWLYSITSNNCKNFLQSRSSRPDREYAEDQKKEVLERPSLLAHKEVLMHDLIHDTLASLPDMQREVLTLYYLGGMSSQEIGEFLGTSANTIKQRLMRARTLLKSEMIEMMTQTFDSMRLQPGFTFRIVEAIKQTKIQAPPSKMTLPFSVSAAAGLIVLLLSMSIPYSPLYPIGQLIGSALPSQTQVTDDGVIPVDVIEITQIVSLSPEMANGDFGKKHKPEPTKASGGGKWKEKTNLPKAMAGSSASAVDEKIYVIGGTEGPNNLPTVYEYDPVTNTVARKADMRVGRFAHSTSVVDGKIYVIGGASWDGKVYHAIETVEVYDPTTDTWERAADFPTPRYAYTCEVGGKIYAIGGAGSINGIMHFTPTSTVEVYDPAADTWKRVADLPEPRRGAPAVVVNGRIYVIGGRSQNGKTTSVVMYDPAIDRWEKITDLPTARARLSASVINGKIYAIGGAAQGRSWSLVEMYDPTTNTWTKQSDMLRPRANLTTSVANGKIYVFGGEDFGLHKVSEIDEFDTELPQSVNSSGKLTTTWGEVKATN